MTERLKTFSVRLKFHDEHLYPQQVTAPTCEEVIKVWAEEYLDIRELPDKRE